VLCLRVRKHWPVLNNLNGLIDPNGAINSELATPRAISGRLNICVKCGWLYRADVFQAHARSRSQALHYPLD